MNKITKIQTNYPPHFIKNIVLALTILSTPIHAYAGTYTDAMTRCFANSTTGKDRTDLARMFFSVMALHPDMADIASISPDQREAINKSGALVYNKLMLDVCNKELKGAVQFEGETAAKVGYEFLGKLAMQELMSNQNVVAGLYGAGKYINAKKIQDAAKP